MAVWIMVLWGYDGVWYGGVWFGGVEYGGGGVEYGVGTIIAPVSSKVSERSEDTGASRGIPNDQQIQEDIFADRLPTKETLTCPTDDVRMLRTVFSLKQGQLFHNPTFSKSTNK